MEQFDKKYGKLPKDITLVFDEDRNIFAQKTDLENILEKNFMNAKSTATSRSPFEVIYPESTMRTIDYGQGHPPRTQVLSYTNNNLLLRPIGKRRTPEITFLERI